ncbi:MAG: OmpA family protein [Desulfocapsaceae bacterium]|jgi:OOP family OmpA-OmpF porin|nr:OmpA family protein [Desulfocapsaceae bacterium]
MKVSKFACACLVFCSLLCALAVQAEPVKSLWNGTEVYLVRKADNFIILYDRSRSMKDIYGTTVMTELAAERKILVEKNATLPDMNWMAGIYSFTPGTGLDNLTTYYPVQPYDKKSFSRVIATMPRDPKGATLLQQGLSELDTVLAEMRGKTVIFLFTDGQYTPVDSMLSPPELARRLAAKYDIAFVVINTGAEKKGFNDIQAIASVNGSSYMVPFEKLLGNPEWMTSALFSVVEKKPEMAKEVITAYEWQNILFDFDKSAVKPEYFEILSRVGAFMKDHPTARIILAGHTDNIGTWDYNIKLSHRRAASVRSYLVEKEGVSGDRITLSGFGYEDPVATNETAQGRALNRRVQGIITGIE